MKPLLSNLGSVLFDLDGTLVETNIDFALMRREMIRLAVEVGLSEIDIQGLDILGIVDAAASALADDPQKSRQIRDDAMRILEEIELRHAHETRQIPFAREIVSHLKQRGIPVGIVTRNCRAASVISLQIAQIETDIMICREDSIRHKPHPEPVFLALSQLNAEAKSSVMVGDHIMDIKSGKAAGTRTIGFLRPDRPGDLFDEARPDFIAYNLREALDAIIGCDS